MSTINGKNKSWFDAVPDVEIIQCDDKMLSFLKHAFHLISGDFFHSAFCMYSYILNIKIYDRTINSSATLQAVSTFATCVVYQIHNVFPIVFAAYNKK